MPIAPENPAAVYLFKKSTPNIIYSNNSGETRWYTRTCNIIPVDATVESTYVLYALNSDGYVAYSTDGNVTWTKLGATFTAGEVHVTASGLATGNYIYAVSGVDNDYVYRWKIVPSTTDWTIISNSLGDDFTSYDIDLSNRTLYVLGYNTSTTKSIVFQALKPYAGNVIWDKLITDAGVKFTNSPKAMVINDFAESKIWAIDSYVDNNHNLYSYGLTKNRVSLAR